MKNTRKKTLFILIMAIISTILMTTLQTAAVSSESIDGIDYSYEGDIAPEKAEQIVKLMYGIPDDTIQPFSILCIFGHSKEYATIITTEHNYYTENPKCRVTYSYVEYCTRSSCSYYAVNSEYVSRTGCH